MTVSELQEQYPGVVCWWGLATCEWWALIPDGMQWKIVNASTPDGLIHAVVRTCSGR
ncbi:hypothetical protein [Actinomadura macra]|uniref:hypothetical protein n=1 Tax=Actinomadura macra TaxID=46164 RepID=UPI0012FC583C|nr:hypothetical protein [Actinomadura macra]